MKKTLYVTDLDGTLMHDDKTISDFSKDIFNKLIDSGVYITYATARSIKSCSQITKGINFKIPVITRNGTQFSDASLGKVSEIVKFSKEELKDIKAILKKYLVYGFVTSFINDNETKLYNKNEINSGFADYLKSHEDDKRLLAVSDLDEMLQGDVCYFTFIDNKENLEKLFNELNSDKRWNIVFQKDNYSDNYWLEIGPGDATKAKAILKLKERYQCDIVVVFGDSLNDISMFEIADESFAVNNAMEEVKKIASNICEDNNDDGVAKCLGKLNDLYNE